MGEQDVSIQQRQGARSASRGTRPVLARDHPVATAFIDESGVISKDRFFAIGLLKSAEPARVLRRIQKFRDRHHWYQEIKWVDMTAGSRPRYERIVDLILGHGDVEFFCFVADREQHDPVARFGSQWDAYGKLAEQLVVAAIHPDELMAIMADNYSAPDTVLFEEELRAAVNRRVKRLAVTSVCRLDSRSSDGLQAVDLLTCATTHEFRAEAGLASHTTPKGELAAYFRNAMGTPSCLTGWRCAEYSVQIYGHSPRSGVVDVR